MASTKKNTTIDMYLLNRGYKKYTDIYALYKQYNQYLELPEEDPDDNNNDSYNPESIAQRVWYFAQKFQECAENNAVITEEVEINGEKYKIERLNNIVIRADDVYYYNYSLLTSWIRGEHTNETLESYFD